MNVAHLLLNQAAERPDATALVEGGGRRRARRLSYAQLDARSAQCAALLRAHGVRAGDAVLIFVPMSIDLYLALIAVFRVGAVATFLDPSAGRAHVAQCCATLPPAALIATAKAHLLRLISPPLRRVPRAIAVGGWPVPFSARWDRHRSHPPEPAIAPREPEDAALVTFTSGSTGRPKAAVRTHGFLAAQHAALVPAIGLAPGQIDLATLPIFSLANLASGVTTVIPDADLRRPAAVEAAPILRQIREHHVDRVVASPAFFERLIEPPPPRTRLARTKSRAMAIAGFAPRPSVLATPQNPLSNLKQIYTGGAPVFPGLLERLARAVPGARVTAVYGSTEAEPIAHVAWDEVSPEDAAAMFAGRGLLAGPAVAEIELRVVADAWGTPLPPMDGAAFAAIRSPVDRAGEIVVCGAHVLGGYLRGEGDEQTKFRVDGRTWHRTGDAGLIDARGRLWLLGRAEAVVRDGDGVVHPFAVECAASRIDGVRRSALVRHGGRRLLAVEPVPGAPRDLPERVREQLAWAKIHEVRLLRRLPVDRRHNAKIDYPALRRILS